MSTLLSLVRHEARDARVSLIAAPCVSAAVLAAVHTLLPRDFSVASAAAYSVAILVSLWTLYFAADLFATDCASGRMRTKSLLPVSALDLWRAKLTFLTLTVGGLGVWTIGCAYAFQLAVGTPGSLAHFEGELAEMLTGVPFLALVAAAGVLCSLVVESALVAMLLSLLASGVLAGLVVVLSYALRLAEVQWSDTHWRVATAVGAVLLLGFGALAFAHGQRSLGLRRVRARVVMTTLGALVVTGGLGMATEIYRRAVIGLEHPRTRFAVATASSDGRYLALEVEGSVRDRAEMRRSVFLLDVATGEHELVAWPGLLLRDPLTWQPLPWDSARSLRVSQFEVSDANELDSIVRVDATESGCRLVETDETMPSTSRLIPTWAEGTAVDEMPDGSHELRVRWRARGLERSFPGNMSSTMLGRGAFLSAHAGRVLALREGTLRLYDLEDEDRADVLASAVTNVCVSPDGSALLVRCNDVTRVLATADGSSLHEPWSNEQLYVQWVEGEGSSRTVRLGEYGRGGREFVKDLDTGIEFELRRNRAHGLLHRLGERGYVFVDRNDDLVWVDPRGERLAVLVDR